MRVEEPAFFVCELPRIECSINIDCHVVNSLSIAMLQTEQTNRWKNGGTALLMIPGAVFKRL